MVKKDDILELDITSMTHEGLGVGKDEGFAIFVQGAIEGERVRAKIMKILKSYAVARIDGIVKKSTSRLDPFCSVYKRCGGCSLQHMSYSKTLAFKRQVVIDNLTRIGGLTDITVNEPLGMSETLCYRNKAQYPVGMGKDGVISGFFARHSHEIIDSDECALQHPISDKAKAIVLDFIRTQRMPVYNETTGQGLIRHVVTKVGFRTGEVMVILVVTRAEFQQKDLLIEALKKGIPNLKSVILNVNAGTGNSILGNRNLILYGQETIEDKLGNLSFEISPLSFYQVNPTQTEVLYSKALEFADLNGTETVYDLYCGIGSIALFAASKAKKVIGVESEPEAFEAAKKNAIRNKIKNTEFYLGDVQNVVSELYEKGEKADVVIVDPPRKGCDEALLKSLVDMAPSKIIYVSCNPSTLARDLKYLVANGFAVSEVQPVDMFPWTEHVETVVLITRVKE